MKHSRKKPFRNSETPLERKKRIAWQRRQAESEMSSEAFAELGYDGPYAPDDFPEYGDNGGEGE